MFLHASQSVDHDVMYTPTASHLLFLLIADITWRLIHVVHDKGRDAHAGKTQLKKKKASEVKLSWPYVQV